MAKNVTDVCKPRDEDRVTEIVLQVVAFLTQENFNFLT